MPANIDSMMYVGEKPWHGLGNKLDKAATSEEAIIAAGLDWTVRKEPLLLKDGRESGTFAVVRQDNNAILGAGLRSQYTPVQNKDKFRIIDSLVGAQEAMYHTAGSLGKGERVWLLAKLPGYIQVVREDILEKYILLADGHDGSLSLQIKITPIRVVCQNTMMQALNQETKFRSILRHTKNINVNVGELRQALGIVNQQFAFMGEAFKKMAEYQMNRKSTQEFIKAVICPKKQDGEELATRTENLIEEISGLFEYGKGQDLPGAKGTLWGAFNAVTEYVDYKMEGRDTKNRDAEANRLKSVMFGSGLELKERAYGKALELIG